MQRQELLGHVAYRILELPTPYLTRVAIDGVDGAGKPFVKEKPNELRSRAWLS
jgi:hypothetical protein